MKRGGSADLPLHGGHVPQWLAQRMQKMGRAITEAIIQEYGKEEFLRRMSDPGWFQSMGAVMGMDWHSSGISTSVLGALKKSLNPMSHETGIYICGGRGKHSLQTPRELLDISEKKGLDGHKLVKNSKLTAKIDNTAIQDGFSIYLHSFVLSDSGDWVIVQQGLNNANGMARRYHWHSSDITSFVDHPHSSIFGKNQGLILNLTDEKALNTRNGILELSKEEPKHLIPEMKKILMPSHHDIYKKDVNLKRLGAVLAQSQEANIEDFESLLMVNGLGPRTLQSLTMVSEIIHGTPSRFNDPARFSFAHGGKDKKPFPVATRVYDKSIEVLEKAVDKARLEYTDRQKAIKGLHKAAKARESHFHPHDNGLEQLKEHEKKNSWKYGGRSIFGKEEKPVSKKGGQQLKLF